MASYRGNITCTKKAVFLAMYGIFRKQMGIVYGYSQSLEKILIRGEPRKFPAHIETPPGLILFCIEGAFKNLFMIKGGTQNTCTPKQVKKKGMPQHSMLYIGNCSFY